MVEIAPGEFVPDFQYRYLSEDMPFGLAVSKAVGQIAGVATPTLDAVIDWSQKKLGMQYLVNGKLTGTDARELRIPQNYGIHTLNDLLAFYLRGHEHLRSGGRVFLRLPASGSAPRLRSLGCGKKSGPHGRLLVHDRR